MAAGVDLVGVERGQVFAAPVAGDLFSDTLYARIMAARAAAGGEVYPIRGIDYVALAAGETVAAPCRGIFASERWKRYGMRFRVAE